MNNNMLPLWKRWLGISLVYYWFYGFIVGYIDGNYTTKGSNMFIFKVIIDALAKGSKISLKFTILI